MDETVEKAEAPGVLGDTLKSAGIKDVMIVASDQGLNNA